MSVTRRGGQPAAEALSRNHDEVVAVPVPPPRAGVVALRIRRAAERGGFGGLDRATIDRPVQEVLDELRGDR